MRTPQSLLLSCLLLTLSCGRSPQEYVERGNQLFALKKFPDASINYRKAIQKDPRFSDAHYKLGLVELELGRGKEAFQAFRRAVELQPENVPARIALGDYALAAYITSSNRPKAIYQVIADQSRALLARDPNSFDGLRFSAYQSVLDNKPGEALPLFRKADQVRPGQPAIVFAIAQLLFQKDAGIEQNREAEEIAAAFIEKQKTFGPIYDLLYGRYVSTQRAREAEALLRAKVDRNPKVAEFRLQLAAHYLRVRDQARVRGTLQTLLDNPVDFPQARLLIGDFYARAGDTGEAMKQFTEGERAQTSPAQRAPYVKRITGIHVANGRRTEALALLDSLLHIDPSDDASRALRAGLLLETGQKQNVDNAVAEFRALAGKAGREEPGRRYRLGQALAASGDLEAAKKEFLAAAQQRKGFLPPLAALSEIALRQNDSQSLVRFARDILAYAPDHPRARFLRSVGLMGTGNLDDAAIELARLIREQPRNTDAQLQMGLLHIARRRFAEAEEIFKRYQQQAAPDDLRAAHGLAQTYAAQQRFDQALEIWRGALKRSPDSLPVRLALGEAALRGGQFDLALEQGNLILSRLPDSPEALLLLGQAYEGKQDEQNAIAHFTRAQRLAPSKGRASAHLAVMMERSGRIDEAVKQYRQALQSRPADAILMNNLAFVLAESGQGLDEALQLAQQAQKLMPALPNVADTLGWIYVKKRMHASAIEIFSGLVRKFPDKPTYRYHLAFALVESGDKTRAKSELLTALQQQPAKREEMRIKELMKRI